MAAQTKPAKPDAQRLPAEVIDRFNAMARQIPEAENDTGLVRILAQVDAATGPEKLDAPWALTGGEKFLDQPLMVFDLKRAPSDYPDGLDFFLIVSATVGQTDEVVEFSTGASSVAAQLVKAYAMGWLPLACIIRKAKKPTKDGYWPQHLEMNTAAQPF